MNNIFKLISISLVSVLVLFSSANASSGTFKLSHDLGFGKDTNLDAITKGRLFQVVIMTQNRLVRKDLKGVCRKPYSGVQSSRKNIFTKRTITQRIDG